MQAIKVRLICVRSHELYRVADRLHHPCQRAHRVGQTRDVHVQTLVTSGTFEEEIARQHGVQQDCQLQQPYRQRPRSKSATKVTLTKGLPSDKRVTDLLRVRLLSALSTYRQSLH